MSFEKRLKEYAYEIGIDLLGITTADPFLSAWERLERMKELNYLSPWVIDDFEQRCNPRFFMEDAESLIAVGIAYPGDDNDYTNDDGKSFFSGKLARFAQYEDYHLLLREKMQKLVRFIQKSYPDVKTKIFVDTGPLLDREVAYRAGLGFFGKNASLINPDYGSFLALGEILLNICLIPDVPLKDSCAECNLCQQACPAGAIKSSKEIDANKCLAHFTQKKGLLTAEISKKLGLRLWGCDSCQDVCPFNQKPVKRGNNFKVHQLGKNPDLEQVLNLSKSQYHELVGETAMAWRGRTTLQRNALINLGNLKDPKAIPILIEALQDQRPVIRVTAVWAITQIRTKKDELAKLLNKALNKEKDQQIIQEIEKALAIIEDNDTDLN